MKELWIANAILELIDADLSRSDLQGSVEALAQKIVREQCPHECHECEQAENDTVEQGFCPHCDIALVARMIDVDGTNLVESDVCLECGYGTPALM